MLPVSSVPSQTSASPLPFNPKGTVSVPSVTTLDTESGTSVALSGSASLTLYGPVSLMLVRSIR